MKYISLFTGIGGFEVALHKVFPDAECIGYSEIKPHAIKVYEQHFPSHNNMGDISNIKKIKIINLVKENGCDLIFGGFPCKNLSSLACIKGGNCGLEGKQSKLFFDMMRIIKIVNISLGKKVNVIFENNASMSKQNKTIITNLIKEEYPYIYLTMLDGSEFGVQCRKRLFWTNFKIDKQHIKCVQNWNDILEPIDFNPSISDNYVKCLNKLVNTKRTKKTGKNIIEAVKNLENNKYSFIVKDNNTQQVCKSRWQMSFHSDNGTEEDNLPYTYPIGKCRPITASFGNHNILVDRRVIIESDKNFIILRMFSSTETERLFGYEDGYTSSLKSKSKRKEVLGNSVIVMVIQYICEQMKLSH